MRVGGWTARGDRALVGGSHWVRKGLGPGPGSGGISEVTRRCHLLVLCVWRPPRLLESRADRRDNAPISLSAGAVRGGSRAVGVVLSALESREQAGGMGQAAGRGWGWGAFRGGNVEAGPAGGLKARPSRLPHCSRPEAPVPQQPRVMVLGRQDVGPSPRVLQALGELPQTPRVPNRIPRAREELCGLREPRGLCSPDSPLDAQLNPHGGCVTLS